MSIQQPNSDLMRVFIRNRQILVAISIQAVQVPKGTIFHEPSLKVILNATGIATVH